MLYLISKLRYFEVPEFFYSSKLLLLFYSTIYAKIV
jgi:hypothetical protein